MSHCEENNKKMSKIIEETSKNKAFCEDIKQEGIKRICPEKREFSDPSPDENSSDLSSLSIL